MKILACGSWKTACPLLAVLCGLAAQPSLGQVQSTPLRLPPTSVQSFPLRAPAAGQITYIQSIATVSDASLDGVSAEGSLLLQQEAPADMAGDCKSDCGDCCKGCCDCCYEPWTFGVFGEYLHMRARDVEVPYAVPVNGPIVPPGMFNGVQRGDTAIVDPDYDTGYRIGFAMAMCDCRNLVGTYTHFDADDQDAISINGGNIVIRSLVLHPQTANAAVDNLDAAASLAIDYDTFDLDLVWTYDHGCNYTYGWLLGLRYARLDQEFRSAFATNGVAFVNTNVDFEGAGLRAGALGDLYCCNSQLSVYARANASFLAGEANADYLQGNLNVPVVVDTSWQGDRLVTNLDMELGVAWESCSGNFRVSAGYFVSAWLNMVKTDEYITAVQENRYNQGFDTLGDMISFDGLSARAELRY